MSGAAWSTEGSAPVEAYAYDPPAASLPCADWELPRIDVDGCLVPGEEESIVAAAKDEERNLADETRRSFEAGRERGMEEGRAAERAAHLPAEQHLAEELRRLAGGFAAGRDNYLRAVEHEVVRLALAVASRILRREAQSDPLLLMGAVRVALGQLAASAEVRLHVPSADAGLWNEAVALVPNPPVRPMVIAEEAMRLGECRLETSLGQVNLGLRAQLDEIERDFSDCAATSAQVPAAKVLP